MIQLIWHGPVFGQSGYEVITRNILIALDKMGVQVALNDAYTWNLEKVSLPVDVDSRLKRMLNTKILAGTPAIMHQKEQQAFLPGLVEGTKKYCYTLFETDKLPEPWKDGLLNMEKIFTFSNFNKEMWVKNSGIPEDKIVVLPYGVEKDFTVEGPKAKILNKKEFTFISNGDFTERKNFEALITAFVEEFKPNENVCLLLKAHFGGFTKDHKKRLLDSISSFVTRITSNPPRILFFGDKVTTKDLANLYRTSDCYVTTSRGEGLGLPVIEAMACGLPVIGTGWSSLADLNFEGITLPYELETIDSVEYIRKCPEALNHKWAEVNVDEVRKAMREVFLNKEAYKQKGLENAKKVQGKTWHDAAVNILKTVHKGGTE